MKKVYSTITIDGVEYDFVDGGIKCCNCEVQDMCANGEFDPRVSIDCTSIHLSRKRYAIY